MGQPPELTVPAIFTNRVKLTITEFGVRIAFGESLDGTDKDENYTQAVFMAHNTFNSVVDLLNNLKAQHEKKLNDQAGKQEQ